MALRSRVKGPDLTLRLHSQPPRIQSIKHRLQPRMHAALTSNHGGGPVEIGLLGGPRRQARAGDVVALADLGLLERTESGGVVCPYSSMHIDMVLKAA